MNLGWDCVEFLGPVQLKRYLRRDWWVANERGTTPEIINRDNENPVNRLWRRHVTLPLMYANIKHDWLDGKVLPFSDTQEVSWNVSWNGMTFLRP